LKGLLSSSKEPSSKNLKEGGSEGGRERKGGGWGEPRQPVKKEKSGAV